MIRFALLILVFCGLCGSTFAETFDGPYFGTVERVIDGDTFEAKVSIWPNVYVNVSVRLLGFDAPELRGSKCSREEALAQNATDALANILKENAEVKLEMVKEDNFSGRVQALVYYKANVNWMFINKRLDNTVSLVPYKTGEGINWCARAK